MSQAAGGGPGGRGSVGPGPGAAGSGGRGPGGRPGAGPGGRPGTGPGGLRALLDRRHRVPVLVAVDTALVAVLVVLAVALPMRSGGSAPQGAGTPPVSAGATTTAGPGATPTPGPPRFRLPSGNIACDMTAEGVTCTIASIAFAPPVVEGCTGTVGHTVTLDADGVHVPCVDGPPPGVAGDDVPQLFYGAQSEVGPYTCASATNGVTCTDESGVGFRLQRAALVTLP